ncbi:MAG: pre-peptidase C-terminal domain-containing protein, partial [Deltaproteobacteria bacterium]|nr:pre-peptidase C-terminal domain-containing protein [Deltaproteobacteria bacterium]MBW2535499.1 pre-peptidase C-terminal domain-containing protein [Deltaproteobacteria bacterium]
TGEECDDGGTDPLDGCDGSCNIEGSCAAPLEIQLTDSGQGVMTGQGSNSTAGGGDQVAAATCDGASTGDGADRIFSFTVTVPSDVTLDVTADFDSVVRLQDTACSTSDELGCADSGAANDETLRVLGLAPGTYYVAVDGATATEAGQFTVDVTTVCSVTQLYLERLNIGADGVAIVNDSSACAVDVGPLELLWDDSGSGDVTTDLPVRQVPPGDTLKVYENPPPGHVAAGSVPFDISRGGWVAMCDGACNTSDGSNVLDLAAFSEGQPHPALPTGVTFSPGGLTGLTNQNTYEYLRSAQSGTPPGFVAADWTVGFLETFEDQDYSDWTNLGSQTAAIESPAGTHGKYAFATSGSSSHLNGFRKLVSAVQPSRVSVRVATDNVSSATGYVVLGASGVAATGANCFAWIYFSGGNLMYAMGAAGPLQSGVSANTFYQVEFRNINWTNGTTDIWVDGVVRANNAGFRDAATPNIRELHFYNWQSGKAWYDEFRMSP